jgi:epoxyqueuosine reductase
MESISPRELKNDLKKRCRNMEIPLMGIANVDRWKHPPFQPWMPEAFYPQSILPEARSVIVIGLPVSLPVLETSPSIYYRELYKIVNTLLDQYTYRLANVLNDRGYPSVFVPRDGYGSIQILLKNPVAFFSHRHAAYLAGLGTFGVNNTLLTPEYGPRVRFGSIFTAADLPPDPLLQEDLCTRCMRCVRMCPSHALKEGTYPAQRTDAITCARYSAGLNARSIAPCGICIKVCPVGNDREHYGRTDCSVYEETEPSPYQQAREHVQRYGGG